MKFRNKIILLIAIFSLFIGTPLLNYFGYTHMSNDGALYFKIHPATYLTFFIFLYCLFNEKQSYLLNNKSHEYRYLICVLIIISYLQLTNRTTELAFIGDTLLTPVFLSIVIPISNYSQKKKINSVIVFFLVFNSFVAILERLISYSFLPVNGVQMDLTFRSTALQGHPLNNALITSIIIAFVYICETNIKRKRILMLLGLISLLCFGSRGALYVISASLFLHYISCLFIIKKNQYIKKRLKKNDSLTTLFYVAFAFGTLIYLLLETKFGARIMEVSFFDEGSAGVRVNVWNMFDSFNLENLLFGVDNKFIDKAMYQSDIYIIENFWLIWLFRFGLILSVMLTVSLYKLLNHLLIPLKVIDRLFLLFVFFGVASTNNSLATSTSALIVFVFCSYAFLKPKINFSTKKINDITK